MREIGMIGLVGVFGLVWGSFLNVLIWRLNDPKAPKFWQGRSLCPQCKHQLAWRDNIPLLSFILLKGKCHYCKKTISWQYPVVELATSVAFVGIWVTGNLGGLGVVGALGVASCFIVIFFSDLRFGLIPDGMILAGSAAAAILNFKFQILNLGENFLVGILTMIPFAIFAKKNWMGGGDVGLAFLIGFLLGWPKILIALWFGLVAGGIVALILLALRKTRLSATIPLGPFLIFGLVVAALWSDKVIPLLK